MSTTAALTMKLNPRHSLRRSMEVVIQSKHLDLRKGITFTAFNVQVARTPIFLNYVN